MAANWAWRKAGVSNQMWSGGNRCALFSVCVELADSSRSWFWLHWGKWHTDNLWDNPMELKHKSVSHNHCVTPQSQILYAGCLWPYQRWERPLVAEGGNLCSEDTCAHRDLFHLYSSTLCTARWSTTAVRLIQEHIGFKSHKAVTLILTN